MLRLSQQGILLAGLPLVLQVLGTGLLFSELKRLDTKIEQLTRAQSISRQCNELLSDVLECGTIIAYDVASSENSGTINKEEYAVIRNRVLSDLDGLAQPKYLNPLNTSKLSSSVTELVDKFDALSKNSKISYFRALEFHRVRPLLKSITDECREILKSETLNESEDLGSLLHRQKLIEQCILIGLLANALLVATMCWSFNRSTAKRLNTLVENSYNLAFDRPLLPSLTGDDEFARLDKTFHQMAQSLQKADADKRKILETVAHDLKNPLTSIHIGLSMLDDKVKDSEDASLKAQIFDCLNFAERLIRMINDILNVENFASGTLPVDLRYVSLKPIIEKSVEILFNLAEARNQKLIVKNLSELEVLADPDRIEQILLNLITNAIKYSPSGATTEISCLESAEWIEVQVKDSGRGIPANARKFLFDRYRQLLPEDKSTGHGIGLSIASTIIDAHDGLIGCESEPGLGSLFWFRLKRVAKS